VKRTIVLVAWISFIPLFVWGTELPDDFERYWPQWRGPAANGVAQHTASEPVAKKEIANGAGVFW